MMYAVYAIFEGVLLQNEKTELMQRQIALYAE